jgi:hypothetical protein
VGSSSFSTSTGAWSFTLGSLLPHVSLALAWVPETSCLTLATLTPFLVAQSPILPLSSGSQGPFSPGRSHDMNRWAGPQRAPHCLPALALASGALVTLHWWQVAFVVGESTVKIAEPMRQRLRLPSIFSKEKQKTAFLGLASIMYHFLQPHLVTWHGRLLGQAGCASPNTSGSLGATVFQV